MNMRKPDVQTNEQPNQQPDLVTDTNPARAISTTAAGTMHSRFEYGHGIPTPNVVRDARRAVVRRLR